MTYERKSENVARVISFGIIIAVLGLLFMGGRNVRAQMGGMGGGMNPFNRLTKAGKECYGRYIEQSTTLNGLELEDAKNDLLDVKQPLGR